MKQKYTKNSTFGKAKKMPKQEVDLSRYRYIYKFYQDKTDTNTSNNKKKLLKEKQKIKKLQSLFGAYKKDDIIEKRKNIWENLTKPKLPFSKRTIIPKDIRLKKIESLDPSLLYHDNHMINWIRNKYSSSVIEKSLYTILTKKNEEKEKARKTDVKNFEIQNEKEKYVKINPKYFYDKSTFKKIKKLKDIFLEFDKNGNNKMTINEIANLFNENNIKVNKDELVKLFFVNKKYKKKDYEKLYLNFYQFLEFSLKKSHDFRLFMRKFKSKLEEENKNKKDNQIQNLYLPMSLNLLLDYFILKSKEKSSTEKIEKAIETINNAIKGIENQSEKIFNDDNSSNNIIQEKLNNESLNLDNSAQINKDDSIENLDFKRIIKEFANLFTLNKLDDSENTIQIQSRRRRDQNSSIKKIISKKNSNDIDKKKFLTNFDNEKKSQSIFYNYSKNPKDIIGNILKQKMNKTMIVNMNIDNYKKFHNINLALDATKDKIDKMQISDINHVLRPNFNYINKKSNFNKSISLKSFPFINKRYSSINNSKKSFIFKYKIIPPSKSMKLFTKNELNQLNHFNRIGNFNESMNKNYNNKRSNCSSYKFNESLSTNFPDRRTEQFDSYSGRKLDYVPVDLFKGSKNKIFNKI